MFILNLWGGDEAKAGHVDKLSTSVRDDDDSSNQLQSSYPRGL